jgi:isocitrate lyase
MKPAELLSTPKVDYLCPIIADADAGFGGITSVMKLTRMFIEAGAGGIHIEDQKPGAKKCGHLGGKVLVSTRESAMRLHAARLQADIMGVDLVILARTDALSATFLDSNVDPVDHPFILGVVDPLSPELLKTFPEVGFAMIDQMFKGEEHTMVMDQWTLKCYSISLKEAVIFAR